MIGKFVFENSKMKSVTLPKNTITIEESAFKNCKLLEKVTFNDGLSVIGVSAFENCYSLTDVTLPLTLSAIDYAGFKNCYSLNTLGFVSDNIVSPKLKHIGDYAFFNTNLNINLEFNFEIISIGSYAFSNTNIKSISIKKVKEFGSYAFAYSQNLESISVEIVDNIIYSEGLFINCIKLKPENIAIDSLNANGVTSAFLGYPYVREVTLSGMYVSDSAFKNCYFLEKVNFTDSVKIIDKLAFSNCYSLEEITIPENITDIKQGAFYDCVNLKKFVVLGNPTISELGIFSGEKVITKVYCKDDTHIKDYCINNDIDYEIINEN